MMKIRRLDPKTMTTDEKNEIIRAYTTKQHTGEYRAEVAWSSNLNHRINVGLWPNKGRAAKAAYKKRDELIANMHLDNFLMHQAWVPGKVLATI